jgi:transcriptional regulator with XRE-family HTH domain
VATGRTKLSELGSFIREQRRSARLSLRKLSDLAGVSNPYLSQIERGLRKPSAEILQAIAKALRISAETLYVQAGILDEGRGGDLVTAILNDPTITERQKQVLIEIYNSFAKQLEAAATPTGSEGESPVVEEPRILSEESGDIRPIRKPKSADWGAGVPPVSGSGESQVRPARRE